MNEILEQILYVISLTLSSEFKNYFLLYFGLFVFGIFIGTIVGLKFIKISGIVIYFVKNYTSFRFGFKGFKSILANNFFISVLMMFIFYSSKLDDFKIFIGKFYFIWMGLVIGIASSQAIIKYNFPVAMSLVVPHGIIEIPTVIFAISFGWILSGLKQEVAIPIFIMVSFILLFLMTISAYIETHITLKIFDKLKKHYSIN